MSTDTAMPEKLGRYEIVRELGRGAMGVVYEAKDPNIGGRRVAIKTARRDLLEGSGHAEELLQRFLNEAKAAGNLNHPSIIRIYDADEQDGTAYIAMEYVEGQDLCDRIEAGKRPGIEEAVELCATICEALDHAHSQGVVHRDIKPANIMMLNDGTIRVADFGIARLEDSELTATGQMIGTPHYMSPEQFQGQKVDGRADLFSVGVMLYEMVTGEKPFSGENLSTVMQKVTMQQPIQPKHLNVSVGTVLDSVLMKILAKAPMERYQSGKDMAAALRECLRENPDPKITRVNPPAVSVEDTAATLVGNTATDATIVPSTAGGDATVVTGVNNMAATVSNATPTASAADATLPRQSPTDTAAPASAISAGVAVAEPAPKKSPVALIAGGGVGVIAVIGAIVWSVMGGGGGESSPAGGATNPGAASVGMREVVVDVTSFKVSDDLVAAEINNLPGDLPPEYQRKFPFADGSIMFSTDDGTPLQSADIKGGFVVVDLTVPESTQYIRWEGTSEGLKNSDNIYLESGESYYEFNIAFVED